MAGLNSANEGSVVKLKIHVVTSLIPSPSKTGVAQGDSIGMMVKSPFETLPHVVLMLGLTLPTTDAAILAPNHRRSPDPTWPHAIRVSANPIHHKGRDQIGRAHV